MKVYLYILTLLLILTSIGTIVSYASSSIVNNSSISALSQANDSSSPTPSSVSQSIISAPAYTSIISSSDSQANSTTSQDSSSSVSSEPQGYSSSISIVSSNLEDSSLKSSSVITEESFQVEPENSPTVLSLPIIESPPPTAFTDTIYYNSISPLGIAGSFHLVGFDTITMNAHTNGNVLANNLYANSNFGTNNLADELSYIVTYLAINSGSATSENHVLVVGASNSTSLVDNGNAIAINNVKLDRPKNVWQDTTTPFIDLSVIKSQTDSLSATLQGLESGNIVESLNPTGGSVDESYISLINPSKNGVFNTTATELSSLKYLGVKKFLSSNNASVVINVDCENTANINLPISLITINNNQINCSETAVFTNGRVIWNFYNFLPNAGTTITSSLLHGSLLATGTNVVVNQNLNGTIVAENINICAESHRDDFVGEIPTSPATVSLSANKTWLTSTGETLNSNNYSAVIQLMRNNIAFGEPVTLNESNNFNHTFNNLDPAYNYSIVEQSIYYNTQNVTDSFTVTIFQQDSQTVSITNRQNDSEPLTLPATGGYLSLILFTGVLLSLISSTLLYNHRRAK